MSRRVQLVEEEEEEEKERNCHTAVDRIPTTPKTLLMPPSRKEVYNLG